MTIIFGSEGLNAGLEDPRTFDLHAFAGEDVESSQSFGFSLAAGILNDFAARDILAVGVPGYEAGGLIDAGGAFTFMVTGGDRRIVSVERYVRGGLLPGGPRTDQRVGYAVAIGIPDIDIDGASLAIGAPTRGGGAGVVYLCHRSHNSGGCGNGVETLSQGAYPGSGAAVVGERFGSSLAFGYLRSENAGQDLVVGSPEEAFGSLTNVGAVSIFYFAEPNAGTGDFWHQGLADVESNNAASDGFGYSLACADLDEDGEDDVVVGVPGKDITHNGVTTANAGAVITLQNLDGADLESEMRYRQGPMSGNPGLGDNCGLSVIATPDFGSSDDRAEVFVGCPRTRVDGVSDAGQVLIY